MKNIGNMDLGISKQAFAVLALLSDRSLSEVTPNRDPDPTGFNSETYAWYNGRERGVCLVFRVGGDPNCLLVTFGEHRNSDGIFVDVWEHDSYFLNPPTVDDFGDEAYVNRKVFGYGRVDQVVPYITTKVKDFFQKYAE